jgi:hypothetical protein
MVVGKADGPLVSAKPFSVRGFMATLSNQPVAAAQKSRFIENKQ